LIGSIVLFLLQDGRSPHRIMVILGWPEFKWITGDLSWGQML